MNGKSNTLKVPLSTVRSGKLSPTIKSPKISIKSNKLAASADSSQLINASPSNKKDVTILDVNTPTITTITDSNEEPVETKTFMMFTDDNGNENNAGNDVTDGYGKNHQVNESPLEEQTAEGIDLIYE